MTVGVYCARWCAIDEGTQQILVGWSLSAVLLVFVSLGVTTSKAWLNVPLATILKSHNCVFTHSFSNKMRAYLCHCCTYSRPDEFFPFRYVCWLSLCMTVLLVYAGLCTSCMTGVYWGQKILGNWSYEWLWEATWELRIEPRSSLRTSVLNCWAVSG